MTIVKNKKKNGQSVLTIVAINNGHMGCGSIPGAGQAPRLKDTTVTEAIKPIKNC